MCVSIPTIGCFDMIARPDPKAPLSSDICNVRQEELAMGVCFGAHTSHVTPILRLDPYFLERHYIVGSRCEAISDGMKTLLTLL